MGSAVSAKWINRKARRDVATPKTCAACHAYIGSPFAFWWHTTKVHGLRVKDYYEQYELNPCRQCGKQIPFRKSRPLTFSRMFCSNQCSGHARHGPGHYLWKGGHTIDGGGYRKVSIFAFDQKHHDILRPMCRAGRSDLLEHRAVVAIAVGRSLTDTETVHHINGNKTDNRPENLELRFGAHGVGVRARDIICPHCGKSYA